MSFSRSQEDILCLKFAKTNISQAKISNQFPELADVPKPSQMVVCSVSNMFEILMSISQIVPLLLNNWALKFFSSFIYR